MCFHLLILVIFFFNFLFCVLRRSPFLPLLPLSMPLTLTLLLLLLLLLLLPSSSSSILFPHTTNSLRVRGIMVAGAKTRKAASIPVADCSSYSWSDQTINVELRLVHQTWPPNCKPVDAHVCLATTKVQYVRSRESTQQWPA